MAVLGFPVCPCPVPTVCGVPHLFLTTCCSSTYGEELPAGIAAVPWGTCLALVLLPEGSPSLAPGAGRVQTSS